MVCFGRQDREVMIMKKFCILVIVAALAIVLGNAPVAMAKGPAGESVTIGWYEDTGGLSIWRAIESQPRMSWPDGHEP